VVVRKAVLWALMCLALAGCATRLEPQVLAGAKRVAIISSAADQLNFVGLAIIALGNTGDQATITQWGLDRHVVERASALIGARYQVVPVPYSPADFSYRALHSFLDIDDTPVGEVVRSKVAPGAAKDIDLYVVITPEQVHYGEYDWVPGILLFHRHLPFADRTALNIVASVTVIDGHSFKRLSADYLSAGTSIDNGLWAESYLELSAPQRDQLAATLRRLIDEGLPEPLRRLGLVS
jgi:hypothetical protein